MHTLLRPYRSSRSWLCLLALVCLTISQASQAQFWKQQDTLLPEQEAFKVSAELVGDRLAVNWSTANDYYLYRDNFDIAVLSPKIEIAQIDFPAGVIEDDPEFGEVEVYFYNALLSAKLTSATDIEADQLRVLLKAQGCNKPVGV